MDRDQDYWQARAEAAERERDNAVFYESRTAAKLAAVREWAEGNARLRYDTPHSFYRQAAQDVLAILDREGE